MSRDAVRHTTMNTEQERSERGDDVQLGLIGLGKMGGNMSERVRRGGHEVVGYDHSRASATSTASRRWSRPSRRRAWSG